jgi:hypothetical protein
VWFASCNACLVPHQNSRSLTVAPDGQICAQTQFRREELLVSDLDVARATRAMFEFERDGMADVLFADTVRPEEFATAGSIVLTAAGPAQPAPAFRGSARPQRAPG